MKAKTFNQLWDNFFIDFLRSNESTILHDAYEAGRLSIKGNACCLVLDKYDKIKDVFKQNYFPNAKAFTLDRHKRAAILVYAFIEVRPITISAVSENDSIFLHLANELLAFYFGLHSMIIDYEKSAINRIVSENNSVFFRFPETHYPKHKPIKHFEEKGYLASVCKDLLFAHQFRNYNILTMADKFFLLETNYCNLKTSELQPDVRDAD